MNTPKGGALFVVSTAAWLWCILTASASILFPVVARAQAAKAIFSQVSGQVRDSKGTPVADATVQLTGPRTLIVRCDASGHFAIANVPPATYSIRVTAKGYADALRTGIAVQNEDVSLDIVLAAATTLHEIARVSVGAQGSINVTGSPSHTLTPRDMAEQGQTQWRKVLEEAPGVSITDPGGFTGSLVPGNPIDSAVVSIRGALPYETAMLIDNMPMYGVTAGLYDGNGLDLSSYDPQAFSSFDVVSGPGAQAPTVIGSIGGSLNLHPAGQVTGNHYDFSIGMDPYGGWINNDMYELRSGKLSATMTYGFDNSPGPLYQTPLLVDGSLVSAINRRPFNCDATCTMTPTYPRGTSGPFYSGQTGGFIACCVSNPNSAWTTHDGSLSLFYQLSPKVIGQFFFEDTNGISTVPNGWVPTQFAPPPSYSGGIPQGSTQLMQVAGTMTSPSSFQPGTQIYEGKFTFQLGQGQLQIAALSNISEMLEDSSTPSSIGALRLYGGGSYFTNPGVSDASTPVVFDGQQETVSLFPSSDNISIHGINHDYAANYAVPLGSKARAVASFVHSYFGYGIDENGSVAFSDGMGGETAVPLDFPSQNNFQETDQSRIGFGVNPTDHLSADASFYLTSAHWHVLNPNDATQSTYVDQYAHYDVPRASLVWRPKPDLAIRASAGGGIAIAPIADFVGTNGAITCYPPICSQTIVNLGLRPETSWGYDFGFDKRLHSGTIVSFDAYNTTLWGQIYNDWVTTPHCQVCNGLPLQVIQYRNLAQTRYAGLELDVRHEVPHGYFWNASGSLMRGYVVSLPGGFYNYGGQCNFATGVDCAAGSENVVPGINFNGSFTNANVPYAQGFALFGYRWAPETFAGVDTHYFGNNNGYYAPAFLVFDANVGVRIADHVSIQGTFRNITNRFGSSMGSFGQGTQFPTAFGPATYYVSIPYGPRTFLMTLRIHG